VVAWRVPRSTAFDNTSGRDALARGYSRVKPRLHRDPDTALLLLTSHSNIHVLVAPLRPGVIHAHMDKRNAHRMDRGWRGARVQVEGQPVHSDRQAQQ
jgi:hypothetical protein